MPRKTGWHRYMEQEMEYGLGLSRSSPKPKQDWSAACTWMPRRKEDRSRSSRWWWWWSLFTSIHWATLKGAVTSFECLERKKNELECLRFNGGLAFSQITKSYIHSFWYICVWRLKQSITLYVWSLPHPQAWEKRIPKISNLTALTFGTFLFKMLGYVCRRS